jgi:hypothetical protein
VRCALIVLAILLSLAPAAHAGEATATSYAVVAFDVSGISDDTVRTKVEAGLTRGVAEAGADLIGFEAVQTKLAPTPALQGCLSATCLSGIASALGTDQLLEIKITANGANYQLELVLVGPSGAARKRTAACTVCTISDLADLAAARVTDLLSTAAGAPVAVSITSRPSGARLALPGVADAVTPWTGQLPPGTVSVDARLAGYHDLHQDLTIVDDGSDHHFDLALRALPPRWHHTKWATAGGAVALLATGVVLLAIDGQPTCSASGATCPSVYQTGVAGAIVGVAGIGVAGLAGWMFWQDRHAHRDASLTASPTADGAAAAVRIRF